MNICISYKKARVKKVDNRLFLRHALVGNANSPYHYRHNPHPNNFNPGGNDSPSACCTLALSSSTT
jgi:hypothetical protein